MNWMRAGKTAKDAAYWTVAWSALTAGFAWLFVRVWAESVFGGRDARAVSRTARGRRSG
jgi:hypothetical protein